MIKMKECTGIFNWIALDLMDVDTMKQTEVGNRNMTVWIVIDTKEILRKTQGKPDYYSFFFHFVCIYTIMYMKWKNSMFKCVCARIVAAPPLLLSESVKAKRKTVPRQQHNITTIITLPVDWLHENRLYTFDVVM